MSARNKRWTVRELRARLRELGCRHVRTAGSHEIWATADGATLPPVSGHRTGEVFFPKGLMQFLAARGIAL